MEKRFFHKLKGGCLLPAARPAAIYPNPEKACARAFRIPLRDRVLSPSVEARRCFGVMSVPSSSSPQQVSTRLLKIEIMKFLVGSARNEIRPGLQACAFFISSVGGFWCHSSTRPMPSSVKSGSNAVVKPDKEATQETPRRVLIDIPDDE